MKKVLGGFLALMCLASVGLAKDSADQYRQQAAQKIAKIMNSDKNISEKAAVLDKKANVLLLKQKLDVEQKVELREYLIKLGEIQYDTLHNYTKAAEYFAKAAIIKDSGLLRFKRGNACFKAKNYEEALNAYRVAHQRGDLPQKEWFDLYWMKGQAEYYTGDYGSAAIDLEKAAGLDGAKWEQAAKPLIICLQERGTHDDALAWLKNLAKRTRDMAFVHRQEASIYYELEQYDKCAKAVDALEKIAPKDDALNLLKAGVKYAQGQYNEAKELLMQEFAKNGRRNTYDYYCNLLLAQLAIKDGQKDGNYEPALLYLDRAVRTPMPTYGMKVKGDIYLSMGLKQQALEHYIAFLKLSPNASLNQKIGAQVAKLQNEIWSAGASGNN